MIPQDNYWKLSLKAWELALLFICVVLALFLSYFFGYRAGHAVGYDYALTESLKNTPKLSVFEDAPRSLSKKELDKMYVSVIGDAADAVTSEDEEDKQVVEQNIETLAKEYQEKLEREALDPDVNTDLNPDVNTDLNSALNAGKTRQAETIVVQNDSQTIPKLQDLKLIENNNTGEAEQTIKEEAQQKIQQKAQQKKQKEESIARNRPEESKLVENKQEVKKQVTFKQAIIPRGWYVQVATTSQLNGANSLVEKLYSSGFKSSIQSYQLQGKQFYRILVGPETNKDYASKLVKQLRDERFISGKPFIKQVK